MSFDDDIKKWRKKVEKAAEAVVRGSMLSLFGKVITSSPVGNVKLWKTKYPPKGYTGGRFRNNWFIEMNQKPTDKTESTSKTGKDSRSRLRSGINRYKVGDTIYFINNLPYSIELEDGTSTQAPWGMVKVNVANFKYIVDEEARRLRSQLFKV